MIPPNQNAYRVNKSPYEVPTELVRNACMPVFSRGSIFIYTSAIGRRPGMRSCHQWNHW